MCRASWYLSRYSRRCRPASGGLRAMFVAMPSRLLNSCLSHKCRDIVAACSRFWQIFLLVLSTTISSGCQKSEDLANSVGSPTHEGVFAIVGSPASAIWCELQQLASVVSHSDGILLSAALARFTFSRMSSAFFVQTKVFGFALW